MRAVAVPFLLALGLVVTAAEPLAVEIHGQLDGAPFWARWQPPNAAFGGKRALQLVYTPPAPERLDGTHLIDCPFILLDERMRILAWNGRDSLSFIAPLAKGSGYQVSREFSVQAVGDPQLQTQEQQLRTEPQWDLHLLPLHLALIWTRTGAGHETAMALFAAKPGVATDVRWAPGLVTVGTAPWHIEADPRGFLGKLTDDTGRIRIEVAGRKP